MATEKVSKDKGAKEIYISSTPHETRLAIVEADDLSEIYYERENEYTLAGSVYNGKVTRVLPGMQSAFVDIGLERDAFLYITDFLEEGAVEGEDVETDGGSSEGREREGGRGRRRGRRSEASSSGEGDAESVAGEGAERDEVGEGAPGADGSRRWRGRRRRGARGERGAARPEGETTTIEGGEGFDDEPTVTVDAEQEERSSGGERRSRRDGSRGRDRDRDRGRGRERDRGERERRPRRDDGDEGVALEAGAEPFILPGETLRKYNKNAAADEAPKTAAAAAPAAGARPSTVIEDIGASVDEFGRLVLPGETLRPREPRREEPRAERGGEREGRGGRESGRGRRADRDRGRGRGDRRERTHDDVPRESEPTESVVADAAVAAAAHEIVHEEEPHVEAETHAEAEKHEVPVEFHETVTEYEPEENASASFRVDPVPPREMRVETPQEEPHAHAEGEHVVEEVHAVETELHHEEQVPESKPHGYAPGEGAYEEELLDEDEDAVDALHAAAEHPEDSEEVVLENAADLASMIRDMTIDEITEPEPIDAEDEDEAFEDEDFEEDELEHGTEEEGADDEDEQSEESEEVEGEAEADAEAGEEGAEAGAESAEGAGERRRRRGRRGRRRSGGAGRESAAAEPSGETILIEEGGAGEGFDDAEPHRERSPRRERDGGRDRFRSRDRDRDRGRGGDRHSQGRSSRRSVQAMDLPAISDLLKPGQEVLVQIAKEPIAKKGARITSHIALPGRFLVFMPTVSHIGVSRRIGSDGERRRLREILLSERGEATGGFIVRTAAEGASEEELRSDLRFLLNLWSEIKARSERSKSPSLIYHDLNLVERILRDQVTDNFSAIWVDTEDTYERVLKFLQRFQPSLMKRVKLYTKDTPLFEQFGITEEINKALRSKVWLKSGGSIVINQTEALVAIDINTGKYVGKTARLEDTIVKTNLDAIPEIVRQIRLRDLGGIIIIDFIDMDERKNRNKVMAALEDELRKDRAPSKVLQFNDFGLVAITRKRVKQSLERTLSTTCNICTGTGMVKAPITVCNEIYIEMRKMHKTIEKGDIMLRVHPEVVKQLKAGPTKWLQEMEEMTGKTILIKSDPSIHPEQFDIH